MSSKTARDAASQPLSPTSQAADDGAPAPAAAPGFAPDDFSSFLSDVAAAVAQHVDGWKQQLAEASARWGALGYSVAVLDRALARDKRPDVDGLLATYTAAVEHLRRLEAYAGAVDPALVGSPEFRDPERVAAAEAALARLLPSPPDPARTREVAESAPATRDAVAAVDAVIGAPGVQHNPLYVHGGTTPARAAILCAAANALRGWRSGRVAYVTAAQFASELAAAMRDNSVERWRARYLPLDVLAVDDVQAVAVDARAAHELALVCAMLREGGRQVLLGGTADPADATAMPEALRAHVARGRAVAVAAGAAPAAARTPARTPLGAVGTVGGDAARSLAFFMDPEKVVWDWPDVGARLIEEIR